MEERNPNLPEEIIVERKANSSEPQTPEIADILEPLIGGELEPKRLKLPEGIKFRITNNEIELDKEAFGKEKQSVTNWLKEGIKNNDEKVLNVYLRNLTNPDEETEELKNLLKEAFLTRDASKLQLDALHVNLPTEQIAERNLIREGLKPEIAKQPFTFRDRNGNTLKEDDLDFIFSRRQGSKGGFKIMVGSKKGIANIVLPEKLTPGKFNPDLMNVDKDKKTGAITIPLTTSNEGIEPSASVIEIRIGPIDVVGAIERELLDQKLQAQRERDKLEEEERYRASQRRQSSGYVSSR